MSNIIDYMPYLVNDFKAYVDVTEVRLKDGRLIPISLVWEDNETYEIDKIIDIRPAATLKAGGTGIRYTVRIQNKITFMYLEEDCDITRWFVEKKTV